MKPQLLALKKYNCGKQITAIEKLIFIGTPTYGTSVSAATPTHSPALPIEIAPTPMLTNGLNSPQSGSLPSASASTIDEDAGSNGGVKTFECPEVVIESV